MKMLNFDNTDEILVALIEQHPHICDFVPVDEVKSFAHAIEAAVLEEQAKAGPVAYKQCSACAQYAASIHCSRCSPLYLHPSPAPEGMVLVPREVLNQCLPIIEAAINRVDLLVAMIDASDTEYGK